MPRSRQYPAPSVNQEMLAALRLLTPFPPLNTVLILPDGDEEIMRGMFELFEEVAKAGSILPVCVLFSGVHVRIHCHPGRYIR